MKLCHVQAEQIDKSVYLKEHEICANLIHIYKASTWKDRKRGNLGGGPGDKKIDPNTNSEEESFIAAQQTSSTLLNCSDLSSNGRAIQFTGQWTLDTQNPIQGFDK